MRSFLLVTAALAAFSLQAAPVKRAAKSELTQTQAEERVGNVSNVDYLVEVSMDNQSTSFSGKTTVYFELKDPKKTLTLDFTEGNVQSVDVNGKPSKPVYNNYYLTVPSKDLKAGKNTVVVSYVHEFSKTGAGLYRFLDPEDQKVYVYSDLEPYDANRIFPCFDQPDLKASFTLVATVPKEWVVISSTSEKSTTDKGENKTVEFHKSARYSTYLFPIHAGPYASWEDKKGRIPLRLFARQSFAKWVNHKEWLEVTKQGFDFFEKYFDYPYPFGKYDQVIVPDFNAGAMENVGAVTFSERYTKRGTQTWAEREDQASVILHEMAHMWFGNLVTMQWWNDLWLNESFATYMATLAMHENTIFKTAWKSFYQEMKQWAYWEDQLVTTHPIEGSVANTSQAFATFDGITYGKGASVLKQLSYYLGPEKFRDGVRLYFKKHQYGNTELRHFIAALSEASGEDLSGWTKEWLRTASLNTVEPKYACKDGNIASFELVQTSEQKFPFLRAHRAEVALYDFEQGKIRPVKIVPVSYKGATTPVPSLVGRKCPVMVYPNHGDHAYTKVKLDRVTLETAKKDISKVDDALSRTMLWQAMWDMVRDGDLGLVEYSDLVVKHIGKETDVLITTSVVQTLYGRFARGPSVLKYLPVSGTGAQETKNKIIAGYEGFFWERLQGAEPGSDFQKLWFDSYAATAHSSVALKHLVEFLESKRSLKGFDLDQDRRWNIVTVLSRRQHPQAENFRKVELVRDPSENGKKAAVAAEVLLADMKTKQKWYDIATNPKSGVPLARLRVAMGWLFPDEQAELHKKFSDRFFADLNKLSKSEDPEFLGVYVETLAPAWCEDASVAVLSKYIQSAKNLNPVALKELKVVHQEDQRCVRVRKIAMAGNKAARSATP